MHFYHYIYNDNSISSSHNEKNHEFVLMCFERIKSIILESDNKENLMKWFNNRLLYVIITTAISGYFNPTNHESYSTKRKKYNAYLERPIISYALKHGCLDGLSKQRRIVLWLIKHKMFMAIDLLGKIRKIQKSNK